MMMRNNSIYLRLYHCFTIFYDEETFAKMIENVPALKVYIKKKHTQCTTCRDVYKSNKAFLILWKYYKSL